MKQSRVPAPKPAPIQQFIAQLREREAATVVQIIPKEPDKIVALADPTLPLVHWITIPDGWSKGALLNVRNRGDHYCVTLYPEEFDPRHPERAMTFPNTWECQDFVSKWYARETADPRAR